MKNFWWGSMIGENICRSKTKTCDKKTVCPTVNLMCHFNCKCAWLSQSLHYCLNFPFIIATKEMHKLVRCNWHLTELYFDNKWFHNVLDATLTDNFQYQNQLVDINNITPWDQRKNVQITDNKYTMYIMWKDQKKNWQIIVTPYSNCTIFSSWSTCVAIL